MSFNKAAQHLDARMAVVSHRISCPEDALGVCLINRTTRQLSLTEASEQYYDDVQNIIDALNDS